MLLLSLRGLALSLSVILRLVLRRLSDTENISQATDLHITASTLKANGLHLRGAVWLYRNFDNF